MARHDVSSATAWWAALVGAATLWFVPIAWQMARLGDYSAHVRSVVDLTHGVVRVPHLLFHFLAAIGILAGLAPPTAAALATVIFQVAAACTVAWFIERYAPGVHPFAAMTLALSVMLVGPILPPGTDRDLYMLGYFLPNAIHNPTVIAAKSFVPLLLSIGAGVIGAMTGPRWTLAAAAAVTVLASVAKPHYVSCLVPAAALWAIVRLLRGQRTSMSLLIAGLALPAVLAIVPIYAMVQTQPGDAGAVVAPLAALGFHASVDAASLVQRMMSDIAFPFVVLGCWPSALRRLPWLTLAWTAYAVSLGQALLLAESGPRFADGNFLWSPQLATFGLFTVSVATLAQWREMDQRKTVWRPVVAAAVLILHVVSGVWWMAGRITLLGGDRY